MKHEIPGLSKVIPGSLDRPLKLVKSLDCPGHPWTVGNYEYLRPGGGGGGGGGCHDSFIQSGEIYNIVASGITGLNSSHPRVAPSDSRLFKPIIPSPHVLIIKRAWGRGYN